jgi:hypothetical protein
VGSGEAHPKYTNPRKLSISSFVTPGISMGEESLFPSTIPSDPPVPPVGRENISAKIWDSLVK